MSDDAQMPGIFFCIGWQKTGTTLLARVLDQHPRIVCLWESYAFRPESKGSLFNPYCDKSARHGYRREDIDRWSRRLGRRPVRTLTARLRWKIFGYPEVSSSVFREVMGEALRDMATRCEAKVAGDKWPWYIDYLDATLEAFPEAKFIYNVRDPRGVWNSGQRFKGRERGDEILAGMLERDRRVSPYLERPEFVTIRYEDLVCQPVETCTKLYGALGCDFLESYLTYNREQDPYPDRWDWVPEAAEQFNPRHTVKWKDLMTLEEVDHVNLMAGEFMERYGYEA